MAEQKNKLIFTTEGRSLLVSQENGVRFAIIGAVLIQGLPPVADLNNPEEGLFATYKSLTLEELVKRPGVVLGLKNISYATKGNQKIVPVDRELYNKAVNEIYKNVLPVKYIQSQELIDDRTSPYGTYEIDIDRTMLAWDNGHDMSFAHIGLIAKQYVFTEDATFNVDRTQRPVLLALAQLDGEYDSDTNVFAGGIQILRDQDKYVAAKLLLRMTVADHDFDFETSGGFDPENPQTKEILDIAKKICLINNGNKTKDAEGVDMRLAIGETQSVINDLHLNKEGSIATPKTLMVADAFNADTAEEQWNAGGLIHVVNKKDDNNNYKYQYVLTSLEQPKDYTQDPLVAYNVGLLLKGYGEEYTGVIDFTDIREDVVESSESSGSSGTSGSRVEYTGVESPIFIQHGIDEYHQVAVDFFGEDNRVLDTDNTDKLLFSKNNVTMEPAGRELYGSNVLIQSNNNLFSAEGGNTNNTLIRSDYNIIKDESFSNLLIGGDGNYIKNGANTNAFFCSDLNTLDGSNTCGNILIGGSNSYLENATGIMMVNGTGLIAHNVSNELILGKYNVNTQADVVYGVGLNEYNRRNALEFYAEQGLLKLYKEGALVAALGGDVGVQAAKMNVTNLTATNFTADKGLVNNYIEFKSNSHTTKITSSNINFDDDGAIIWGDPNNNMHITKNDISLKGIAIAEGGMTLRSSDGTRYAQITPEYINLKSGINNMKIDTATGAITVTNNGVSSQVTSKYRKFIADIYVINNGQTDRDKMVFMLGNCFDTGENNIAVSPMYNALKSWFKSYMLGYTKGGGEGENTYYWNGTSMIKGETIDASSWKDLVGDGKALFKFFDNDDKKQPMTLGYVPNGYDEIDLNIYYRDIDDDDFIFSLVPVTNYNQTVRFNVTINQGWIKNSGEDIRAWKNIGWSVANNTGIIETFDDMTSFAEFCNIGDTDKGGMLILKGIACPSKLVTNWNVAPPLLGWHYARY